MSTVPINYTLATEQLAYEKGNPWVATSTPVHNKLCTAGKAVTLGCCVNKYYSNASNDLDSYSPNSTGIEYTRNQLICVSDLSVDPGIINSLSKTIGFDITDCPIYNSSGSRISYFSTIVNNITGYEVAPSYTTISNINDISYDSFYQINFPSIAGTTIPPIEAEWIIVNHLGRYYLTLTGGKITADGGNAVYYTKNITMIDRAWVNALECFVYFDGRGILCDGSALCINMRIATGGSYSYISNQYVGSSSSMLPYHIFNYSDGNLTCFPTTTYPWSGQNSEILY